VLAVSCLGESHIFAPGMMPQGSSLLYTDDPTLSWAVSCLGESHIFAPGMMTARVITTIHG
jgi:hypothetical protein